MLGSHLAEVNVAHEPTGEENDDRTRQSVSFHLLGKPQRLPRFFGSLLLLVRFIDSSRPAPVWIAPADISIATVPLCSSGLPTSKTLHSLSLSWGLRGEGEPAAVPATH
jgi:hypothetical protein